MESVWIKKNNEASYSIFVFGHIVCTGTYEECETELKNRNLIIIDNKVCHRYVRCETVLGKDGKQHHSWKPYTDAVLRTDWQRRRGVA